MDDKLFKELEKSLVEMVEDTAGKKKDLRTTKGIRSPKPLKKGEIKKIRTAMNVSQALFARLLNCSVRTVQAWEHGTGEPSGPSLKLLEIAAKNPKALYNN